MFPSTRRQQRGDTIVEVLISIAVLSMVIGGAYSIVNSALRASRQAQERSEATKLAETQLESLKTSLTGEPTPGVAFCISSTGAVVQSFGSPSPTTLSFTADNYAAYGTECKFGGIPYHVFIVRNNDVYTVNVRWNRIGGGKEQVQMVYRRYVGE
jgi:type II secretory pathway pseudopilin PulG